MVTQTCNDVGDGERREVEGKKEREEEERYERSKSER